jgi:hypothetical protein
MAPLPGLLNGDSADNSATSKTVSILAVGGNEAPFSERAHHLVKALAIVAAEKAKTASHNAMPTKAEPVSLVMVIPSKCAQPDARG